LATLKIENMRVELGDAHVVKNHILRIHDENS
jgi:hypothetical protein